MKTRIRVGRLFVSPGYNFFGHHDQPPGAHPVVELDRAEGVAGRGGWRARILTGGSLKRDAWT